MLVKENLMDLRISLEEMERLYSIMEDHCISRSCTPAEDWALFNNMKNQYFAEIRMAVKFERSENIEPQHVEEIKVDTIKVEEMLDNDCNND